MTVRYNYRAVKIYNDTSNLAKMQLRCRLDTYCKDILGTFLRVKGKIMANDGFNLYYGFNF
jgi:hypothetical protein